MLSFARFFARTPWTTLTVLLGVSLGVASTVAVHLISLSVAESLDSGGLPHLRGVTHIADKRDATMGDYFELRGRWRNGELRRVIGLVPIVDGQVVEDGRRFHVVGADWFALYGLPSGGAPAGLQSRSVLVDTSLGLAEGDRLQLGEASWLVGGVVDSGVTDGLFVDIGDALGMLNASPDRLSSVGVAVQDPWAGLRSWLETLLPGLSAGLPEAPQSLAGWEVRPVAVEQPGAGFAESVLFNLGALGSLALLVAWFLIYQVCVLWLRRQVPVLDSLAALGANSGELRFCFLFAVALLGGVATLVGTVAGAFLADLLTAISTAGLETAPDSELSAAVVVKALVSGFGIAVIGAWMAFRRWLRPGSSRSSRMRWSVWCGVALVLVAIGVGAENSGLFGGFAAILAVAMLAVSLVAPILRLLRRWLAAARGGLLVRLAIREATWFEGDVGTALGALVLAIGTSVGIGLMVDSFKLDFERMLTQRLAHEFFVELGGQNVGVAATAFSSRWPGARAQAYGSLRTRIDGRVVEIGHTAFSVAEAARYGHRGALQGDQGLASESLILALGIDVGDTVAVAGEPVRVVGTFSDYGAVMPRLLLPDDAVARRFGDIHFTGLGITGVTREELDGWLADHAPESSVRQRDLARMRALEIFDRSFAITNALTLLALTVAMVGLYNAMVGLRLNRLATGQLLTALGVTSAENRLVELIRALGLGAFAVLLALPLGLAMGAILCGVINPRAFGWSIGLAVPATALAWPAGLGFLAAVAAAVAPSPRERLYAH